MIGWGFKARKAQKSQERPSKQRWGLCGNNFLGPCFGDRILDQKKTIEERPPDPKVLPIQTDSKRLRSFFTIHSEFLPLSVS